MQGASTGSHCLGDTGLVGSLPVGHRLCYVPCLAAGPTVLGNGHWSYLNAVSLHCGTGSQPYPWPFGSGVGGFMGVVFPFLWWGHNLVFAAQHVGLQHHPRRKAGKQKEEEVLNNLQTRFYWISDRVNSYLAAGPKMQRKCIQV